MPYNKLTFRTHATKRMFLRNINAAEVRNVLAQGVRIEDYPQTQPYPSYLMLGYSGKRPIHVVAADNDAAQETIVITVYVPDPRIWGEVISKFTSQW